MSTPIHLLVRFRFAAGLFSMLALSVSLFTGCADSSTTVEEAVVEQPVAPISVAENGAMTVNILANDLMQWDVKEFTVQPGQEVTVHLTSEGRRPKRFMAHNFVLLQPQVDMAAFIQAATVAQDDDYLPKEYEQDILAASDLAGAGETVSITFTASNEEGEFPYVCTFPGHYYAGMNGVMTVKSSPDL